MKIDVYTMVHNEERILPYFIRHYESFAQHIFVFEDQSTDDSRKILEANSKVTIIEPELHGINEVYWTQELWPMYEQLSRGKADYVIQVDTDELVYHRCLLEILTKEKRKGTQQLYCKGFTMIADEFPDIQKQLYEEIKTGLPDKLSNKWAIFDPAIRLRYSDGRHRVIETSATKAEGHSGIKLLHYRWMGKDYFEDRDKRNRQRFNVHDKVNLEYDPNKRHNLPDGSRGIKLQWYTEHKDKATNVVD